MGKITKFSKFNYIPFSYTFKTRITTLTERLSWIVLYPAFLLYCALIYNLSLVFVVISFVATMCCYEIGYISNDVKTVKSESNPTLRLSSDDSISYESRFFSLVACRYIISAAIIVFAGCYFSYFYAYFLFFCLVVLSLTFYIHNSVRSRLNIITYFSLVSLRYLIPLMMLEGTLELIIVILSFPLCRSIEHSCKTKYDMKSIRRIVVNPDFFRFFYYIVLVLFSMILCYFTDILSIKEVSLFVYFLLFRSIALMMSVKGIGYRKKHRSYDW